MIKRYLKVESNREKHFVKTSDPDVAKQLREAGFVELAKEGDRFVFLNEIVKFDRMNFEKKKVDFDSMLMF